MSDSRATDAVIAVSCLVALLAIYWPDVVRLLRRALWRLL